MSTIAELKAACDATQAAVVRAEEIRDDEAGLPDGLPPSYWARVNAARRVNDEATRRYVRAMGWAP